jgi:hypothetical protein
MSSALQRDGDGWQVTSGERQGRPKKGEWNDGEFESFLADIQPTLETSVGRLGVAGSLGNRSQPIDPSRLVLTWPDIVDRIVEDLR